MTKYEAGLFEGLVDDWPALQKWDLTQEKGVMYLWNAFGKEDLLYTLKVSNQLYADHRTSASFHYINFGRLMDSQHAKISKAKYKTLGGVQDTKTVTLLLDQEIPLKI